MNFRYCIATTAFLFLFGNSQAEEKEQTVGNLFMNDTLYQIPIGGNTFAHNEPAGAKLITNNGVEGWSDAKVQFTTYFRIHQPGTITIWVWAKANAESRLQIGLAGRSKTVNVGGGGLKRYEVGEWKVTDTGYLKIMLTGLSKTGEHFPDIASYEVAGTAISTKTVYVKNNEGNFFYWGRRGPSVHLKYPFPDGIQVKWFYNEVTVPQGQDVVGSFFMTAGFNEGYFGMQVNSATERRILFSVWSPFHSDNPKSVPPEQRIIMLKKGGEVATGEFGNEGSGGQSFLRYNWRADVTYKFLLKGEPMGNNTTTYTAYFFAPEKSEWLLIASFRRPQTTTWLKGFHSFLENFIPEQGDKNRQVFFGNQWIADANGHWTELTKAIFTYDATAKAGYRVDYAGGVRSNQFFLKNCGFFSDYTPYGSVFERNATQQQPVIEWDKLP